MKLKSPYRIKPGAKIRLGHLPTGPAKTNGTRSAKQEKQKEQAELDLHRTRMIVLQDVLYAEQKHALLVVLQGMDTAGKDGTISHIFSGVNPQGCDVSQFKVPTPLETRHDFLWRAHNAVPPRGMIGIFNRSHYEDVLAPRVHGLITQKEARRRFDEINGFERMLSENDVVILKFFLHISREEQGRRLQDRISDPDKHWKLSEADFRERKFWNEYTEAYQDALSHTSHSHAPWFVIPSDDKHHRNVAVSGVLLEAMQALRMKFPKPTVDPKSLKLD
ncbi:MAG: polyphosphate kinase 2 family protein [Acidobacteriaceae bacterium]